MKILALIIVCFSQFSYANCEKNLEGFLSAISENRDIQEQSILYPLKYTYVDIQSPDMSLVEKMLSEQNVKDAEFSVYPLKSRQEAHGLVQKVLENKKGSAKVSVFKPDTDYSLIYKFQLKSGCWSLVEYIDQSL
ncbi:MAG TPA: hypothetical protein PK002_07385 [Cellvibrio sp.]|nr:hypothetical protein [Cellvibrio sp.]